MTMKKPTMLLFAAAVAIAGCSRSDPEPEATNTVAVEDVPDDGNMTEALPEPAATPVEQNATVELPPEERAAPDEQMLDDASATGMTSRVQRDAEEAPANGR